MIKFTVEGPLPTGTLPNKWEQCKYSVGINTKHFKNKADTDEFLLHFQAALKALYLHALKKMGHSPTDIADKCAALTIDLRD